MTFKAVQEGRKGELKIEELEERRPRKERTANG